MMKGKNSTWILLIVAILIWGIISYKIHDAVSVKPVAENVLKYNPTELKAFKSDSAFELKADYRDPFLGTYMAINKTPSPVKSKIVKKVSLVAWPKIIYQGTMKKNLDDKLYCILNVNNRLVFLKQGSKFDELSVKKIFPDSVLLSYKGESKYIVKR